MNRPESVEGIVRFKFMRSLTVRRFTSLLPIIALATSSATHAETGTTVAAASVAAAAPIPTAAAMMSLAPDANPLVLNMAAEAVTCAEREGEPKASRIAVIDFTRPSTQPRLWVFDLDSGDLLFEEYVAHGQGTGSNMAEHFSNLAESHQSSLGLFRTGGTYEGRNGYSLRLDGLEPGVNDNAMSRAIVVHGADYVSKDFIKTQGRLGRSYGCPAVRRAVAKPLIDAIKDNQYLFAYYPDSSWLKHSKFMGCQNVHATSQMAQRDTGDTGHGASD